MSSASDIRPAAPKPAEPALSATILLVRDAARPGVRGALEVFMVERHRQIDFATGALVFPGGKVDPGDRDPALRPRCRGADGLDDDALAVRVAAIRETFEESGVLLAGPPGDGLVDAPRLATIQERFRASLEADDLPVRELVESEGLELACDRLVPFAHWITPEPLPKRYDTWFFLVAAPEDQLALHDGRESVDSVWTTVDEARAAEREGRRTIIFPTLMNLGKLGQSRRVDEALEAARQARVVSVTPRVERDGDGRRVVVLPPEAGYDLSWAPAEFPSG